MAQDFGINPQLGLSLHQMAGPEERATTRAKLEDLQAQVQERAGNAQKTQLANQQTQTKMGAEAAVRKMLQDKQAAGQDPTEIDFVTLLGPDEGFKAATSWADVHKKAIESEKLKTDEMQKQIDTIANGLVAIRNEKDPVKRVVLRDQLIQMNHPTNGGTVDPKLLDRLSKIGLTDSELDAGISQSLPAIKNAADQRKAALDEAQQRIDANYKMTETKNRAGELALNTRKQDFEEKKPVVLAPNATMATPQGAPIFTAPPAPVNPPQPTAPMSPERFSQEQQLAAQRAAEARATKEAGAGGMPPLDSLTATTRSGRKYVDTSQVEAKGKNKLVTAAAAAGIPAVDKATADILVGIDNAKENLDFMMQTLEPKLASGAATRPATALNNTIQSYLQTDDELSAVGTYRNAAIQAMREVAGSKGLRINRAEIELAIQNDIPKITDTVGAAKQKLKNMKTFLENAEKAHLVKDRSGGTPAVKAPDPLGIR